MPTSYQAPKREDSAKTRTHSQSPSTNTSSATASVSQIIETKGDGVYSIKPHDTLGTAVEVLRDKRIGALVVVDETGDLIGILSERDIVRKLADTPGRTLPQSVGDVMTKNVQTCAMDDPLISVLKRMTDGRFRHMPVMSDGKLAGMLTIGDVINHRLTELEHEALQLKQLIVG